MDYYKATRNPDGTFNVPNTPKGELKNVPYIGTYDDYREMAVDYDRIKEKYSETGYVTRSEDDTDENIFVLFYPGAADNNGEFITL